MNGRRTIALALGVGVLGLAAWAFLEAGSWLVVADPVRSARAAVVLAGQVPFRAMEAAAFYRQKVVMEVWLLKNVPSDEDTALTRLGIERPGEYAYSQQVLNKLGVPGSAIRVLPEPAASTADELRAVVRNLDALGGKRVVLVTSKYHTRRVRTLWRALAGDELEAVVRYAPGDPFRAERWWQATPDAIAVTREWFGLWNAWAGFPIDSRRP